jgi:hypothetical protein
MLMKSLYWWQMAPICSQITQKRPQQKFLGRNKLVFVKNNQFHPEVAEKRQKYYLVRAVIFRHRFTRDRFLWKINEYFSWISRKEHNGSDNSTVVNLHILGVCKLHIINTKSIQHFYFTGLLDTVYLVTYAIFMFFRQESVAKPCGNSSFQTKYENFPNHMGIQVSKPNMKSSQTMWEFKFPNHLWKVPIDDIWKTKFSPTACLWEIRG